MANDRIERATRILVEIHGRRREYSAGLLALTVHGYTAEEQAEALRLWRVWKRGMRETERRGGGDHGNP